MGPIAAPAPAGSALRGYVRLVHPFPSLLVTAVTVAMAFAADRSPETGVLLQLGLGMLLYQFAIGAANDVVDLADDAETKPWKPLVRGDLRTDQATRFAVLVALAGLALTFSLPLVPWLLGVGGLLCGLAYDFGLKRTRLSWLPLSVALPLVPAWVFTALDAWDPLLWWLFPAGITAGLAVHLANELPDAAEGPAHGGSVHRMGTRRAYGAAMGALGTSVSICVVALAFSAPFQAGMAAIIGAAAFISGPRATKVLGRNGLFGVVAMTTAMLGVVFVSATR